MGDFFNIDSSSVIDSSVKMSGEITIGKNCKIQNSRLNNVAIGDNVTIIDSNIDGAEIHNNVKIGPYARIRPGSVIMDGVSIGNFCEIKNSTLNKSFHQPGDI